MRLINYLMDFGYFKKDKTQFLAYWRNQDILRLGPGRRTDAHLLPLSQQKARDHLYVTAFRRPFQKDGKKGYKVVFVLMNEYRDAVQTQLHLLKPERLFGAGGSNAIRLSDEIEGLSDEDKALAGQLNSWMQQTGDVPVLRDIESGRVVARSKTGEDGSVSYGPIWIPYHNYRILYGYSVTNQ